MYNPDNGIIYGITDNCNYNYGIPYTLVQGNA